MELEKNLTSLEVGQSSKVIRINTSDDDIQRFLFTLGCYKGETVTLVSILSGSYVMAVKDARYSIDKDFAKTIIVE